MCLPDRVKALTPFNSEGRLESQKRPEKWNFLELMGTVALFLGCLWLARYLDVGTSQRAVTET